MASMESYNMGLSQDGEAIVGSAVGGVSYGVCLPGYDVMLTVHNDQAIALESKLKDIKSIGDVSIQKDKLETLKKDYNRLCSNSQNHAENASRKGVTKKSLFEKLSNLRAKIIEFENSLPQIPTKEMFG